MKRSYSKPTIHVEVMAVDMPIATSCASTGDSFELRLQGWFMDTDSCSNYNTDWNDRGEYGDSVCYHSNIITGFSS